VPEGTSGRLSQAAELCSLCDLLVLASFLPPWTPPDPALQTNLGFCSRETEHLDVIILAFSPLLNYNSCFFSSDVTTQFMINVVCDKYLKEEEEVHEKKTEEILIKQEVAPEASTPSTLVMDVFRDTYTSKVMAIKAPLVFSLAWRLRKTSVLWVSSLSPDAARTRGKIFFQLCNIKNIAELVFSLKARFLVGLLEKA